MKGANRNMKGVIHRKMDKNTKRRAVSSILVAVFLIILAMGIFLASYYVEYSEIHYNEFANTVPSTMKVSAVYKNGFLNVTNGGHQTIVVEHLITAKGTALNVWNYTAGVNAGQSVSIYFPISAQRYGIETNYGVEWANET